MSALLEIGLTNAALATLVAILVFCATRIWRNPHLAHVLWLLVLVKLVTPPVLEIPVPWPAAADTVSADQAATTTAPSPEAPNDKPRSTRSLLKKSGATAGSPSSASIVAENTAGQASSGTPLSEEHLFQRAARPRPASAGGPSALAWSWRPWMLLAWLCGSLVWTLIVVSRVVRFQRVLAKATPASRELVDLSGQVARDLGVRRAPPVLVVAARFPPLLWPVARRPKVILPSELTVRLSESQLRDVLAHEIAHLARRDHWVRWLEMLVGALYWWHPVLWFARRQLRAAEEACCDLLVVRRCRSADAREYARTLLEIVEFSSGTAVSRPALGSGMGGQTQLKGRIEMLLRSRIPGRLSTLTKFVLLLTSISVLPLSAAAWQAEKKADPTPPPENEKKTNDAQPSRGMRVVINVPAAPYRIAPGDLLEINAAAENALPDAPIEGLYLVEPSGKVQLGRKYGRVSLKGQTLEEAEETILRRLSQLIVEPHVAVTIGGWRSAGKQELVPIPKSPYRIAPGDLLEIAAPEHTTLSDGRIDGLYLVEPSGKVHLGAAYGRLQLQGLTLEEAEETVNQYLGKFIVEPQATVRIGGWKLALERSKDTRFPRHAVAHGPAVSLDEFDDELVAALREFVEFLDVNHETANARYKVGQGGPADVLFAAYRLSLARSELALAEGDLQGALDQCVKARTLAESSVKRINLMRTHGGPASDDLRATAANHLLQAKIKLIAVKRAVAAAGVDRQEPRP